MSSRATCISICIATALGRVKGWTGPPGRAAQEDLRVSRTGPKPAWQGRQMDTIAPVRPTVLRERRISLIAGPAAAGTARRQVRSAIYAWNVPIDPATAVLLTSELVTNAIRHEVSGTVKLIRTCACGRLRVVFFASRRRHTIWTKARSHTNRT